jgi:acyl-CoA thioester hydrolase
MIRERVMPQQSTQVCDFDVDVAACDIDELGHVNNAVYLTWVQKAVLHHWNRFASKEAVSRFLWVALAHQIRYRHPAYLNEHVVVRVALEKILGARAFYKSVVSHGDQVLAEVESSWCCIDAATRKPVRLARELVARFMPALG